jgi:indoleamine 2,3-dioxygenase
MNPDPIDVPPILPDETLHAAAQLSAWIAVGRLRMELERLPIPPLPDTDDVPTLEGAYRTLSFLATAYVHTPNLAPARVIPAGVAVPLAAIAARLERPPILAYCGLSLNNWRRRDPAGSFAPENLDTLLNFTGSADETWFTAIHVSIEAQAACALDGMARAADAAVHDDPERVEAHLMGIARGLNDMTLTFRRMTEGCDPDIYFDHIRPFFFGFTDVIYDGAFDGQPQTYRGGTGAQSSIVPALVAGLGIAHEQNDLTHHLYAMQPYMPAAHRAFIARMSASTIRACVERCHYAPLIDVYNAALSRLLTFRQTHLGFARAYIFNKSKDAYGTGGTNFMAWLKQLADETERHLL